MSKLTDLILRSPSGSSGVSKGGRTAPNVPPWFETPRFKARLLTMRIGET